MKVMSFGDITGSYFTLVIPKSGCHIAVSECRGDYVDLRITVERQKWDAVADSLKFEFNRRLKGRRRAWQKGENQLERTLGQELMVLLWAIEDAHPSLIETVVKNWMGLRPEERWWLYYQTNQHAGKPCHRNMGWRAALKVALTENPTN